MVALALTAGGVVALFWRYAPVRVAPQEIKKVFFPDSQKTADFLCENFKMTPDEFSAYFAKAHRLTAAEEDEYGYGGCYYEARVGKRVYRIWIYGMAQIGEGEDMEFYAASEKKLLANP